MAERISCRWIMEWLSAAFVFDEDLASQLEIEDFSDTECILLAQRKIGLAYVELLLRAANVRAEGKTISSTQDNL